jgi:hypothetical protein
VELVVGTIHATGLADGRHTVFIRGRDADDNWGPVSAVFFWVLDPANAAHIAGVVTSAENGAPLGATVSTGIFTTLTSPASGGYDLMLPGGVYDVTAAAEGFGRQTATAVAALPGAATPLDFVLTPYEIVLEDDVETGNFGWTAEGQWAITDEASASPNHSWTDSPGGDYGNNWDRSLVSPRLDFFEVAGVTLEFSHIYDLESGWDYALVEISTDDGGTWSTVASYNGTHTSGWEAVELDLGALDHIADARIRFRIDTDGSVTEDGWHIDDIVIRGFDEPPPGSVFRDTFETGDTSAWSAVAP